MSIDFFDPVLRAIKHEWQPKNFSKERGYQEDLTRFLKRKFANLGVKPEPHKRLADIQVKSLRNGLLGIGRNIGIEIKYNMGKSERNRLQGQLMDDLSKFQQVFCVLCGDNRSQYAELQKWAQENLLLFRGLHLVIK